VLEKLYEDVARVREDVAFIRGHMEADAKLDHEQRLSALEKWRTRWGYPISGISGIALIAGVIAAVIK
jgi:hypothetical protein